MQFKEKVYLPVIKVKVCGLSTPEAVTIAIENGADFIGLVFYPPSPRHVELEVASYLASFIPDHVTTVGLFVNPDDTALEQTLSAVPLQMIQLHGDETPERVTEIKGKFGLPVMKALPISTKMDIRAALNYEGIADWILFDAKGETLPGGNGVSFDWNLLGQYKGTTPWMLAGGLTPDNISEALQKTSPHAVDVSSGIEATRGKKDIAKIQAFLKAVKQA